MVDIFSGCKIRTAWYVEFALLELVCSCTQLVLMYCGCRVRDFEVVDIFPFGVAFDWEKDGEPTSTVLFERNCAIPSAKVLTFHRCAFQPKLPKCSVFASIRVGCVDILQTHIGRHTQTVESLCSPASKTLVTSVHGLCIGGCKPEEGTG